MSFKIRALRQHRSLHCCPPGTGRSWNNDLGSVWSFQRELSVNCYRHLTVCCRGMRNSTLHCEKRLSRLENIVSLNKKKKYITEGHCLDILLECFSRNFYAFTNKAWKGINRIYDITSNMIAWSFANKYLMQTAFAVRLL